MAIQPVRVAIAILLPLLLAVLSSAVTSAWLVAHSTPAAAERALGWGLGNALLWRRTARASVLTVDDAELEQGIERYRQTLARNPLDTLAWEGLTTLETRRGGDRRGEAPLRGWIAAIPNSPRATWSLANLLLRQGRTDEALPYFRLAAARDAALRPMLFSLAWKALDDPDRIFREVVPEDEQSRTEYFNYLLMERADLRAVEPVWQRLRQMASPRAAVMGMVYAEKLANAGQGQDADRIWRLAAPQAATTGEAGSGERITNGDFERPLVNAGLDWRLLQAPGYHISFDDFSQSSGSRSLRVEFDGSANPEFGDVLQWIVVEPNRDYRFRASMKTDNLSSDSGVYWSLSNGVIAPEEFQEWTTAPLRGTNNWTHQAMDLRTAADTSVLVLQLRRRPSARPDGRLQGTAWVDGVSLLAR